MSREIPEPIRAAAGLAATVLDEARKLPGSLPGLPIRLVGLAMQTALKVQQQWSGLVARGDEVFTGIRGEDEPGLATFDEDLDDLDRAPSARASARDSAFDRAVDADADTEDEALSVDDTAAVLDETDAVPGSDTGGALVDDEVSGLAAADDPAEVVETLQDITDQVAALGQGPADAEAVLTPEDALAAALLETDGGDTSPADDTTPAGDGTGVEVTEVDVLTFDGEVATVAATITDEAVAAPEGPTDAARTDDADQGAAPALDEGGTTVAAATGVRTDVGEADPVEEEAAMAAGAAADAVGATPEGPDAVPTDDPQGGSDLSGSQAAGSAPVDGYDGWTVAQLRGRLRGYQIPTVEALLAYEEATRDRDPFVRMLRNRLEKLERLAVEASPLVPRGM